MARVILFFFLQNQFNVVSYEIVGDNEAVNLFSINQNGDIFTTSSLFGRSEASYVVSMSLFWAGRWCGVGYSAWVFYYLGHCRAGAGCAFSRCGKGAVFY